jgi:N6-adenosine-specific RNA methylase IME4
MSMPSKRLIYDESGERLRFHPFADLFPLLEGDELTALKDDIAAHGLREPIVVYKEMILDGRNRFPACQAIQGSGGPALARYAQFKGDDPLAFVLSMNLKRRHLDESQRAWIAAKIANMGQGGDGSNQHGSKAANLPVSSISQPEAARMLNVSERSVRSAAAVRDHGAKELQRAVEQRHLPVSLAAQAAKLPHGQQREIAKRAEAGDVRAVSTVIKKDARAAREAELGAKQMALPDKRYGVILADPAWPYKVYSPETGMDRSAENHYPTSSIEEIAALDVASIAARDCALFLWSTAFILKKALYVMEAWGFEYKSHAIWAKHKFGNGYWFHNKHEVLLVGTRGEPPAPAFGDQWESWIEASVGEHSAKPEKFLQLIEAYFPSLPKIELNRRGPARWAGMRGAMNVPRLNSGDDIRQSSRASL